MKIKVTQEHINAGTKQVCTACPIAHALKVAWFPSHEF